MTNLEYYKDEIEKNIKTYAFWGETTLAVSLQEFLHNHIKECGEDAKSQLYWLLDLHVTPIRLKQWEKDLLEMYKGLKFENWGNLMDMKKKGYFQGVVNTKMEVDDILGASEVEE